jgi:hypothetical protein
LGITHPTLYDLLNKHAIVVDDVGRVPTQASLN